jgi:DNA topoisomerase-3
MRLFIAEKPELARAIADGIGENQKKCDGYIQIGSDYITWCFGHLLQLKDPQEYNERYAKWNLEDLPLDIKNIQLKIIKGKEKQVEVIRKLVLEATEIVNAGDPDEEGQLLVDELLDYFNNKKPVKRILINDNTSSSIVKALSNLKDNKDFIGLKNSAYVRSVGDFKYGLNLTRAYTLKANNGKVLSVGRVQTPILNLVYQREEEVKNHKKEMYYNLKTHNKFTFTIPKDKLEDNLCKDKIFIENIRQEALTQNNFAINEVVIEEIETPPPLPYNLLELQADAFKKFKYKPDQIKDITQNLREKYKAITYNRSDCQYLTDEHYTQREDLIKAISNNLKTQYDNINTKIKHKAFNNANVSAHHAIIPTIYNVNVDDFTIEELNVYKLICERYIILFLKPQKVEKTTFKAINNTNLQFTLSASKIMDCGYKAFYGQEDDEKEQEQAEESNASYAKGDCCN